MLRKLASKIIKRPSKPDTRDKIYTIKGELSTFEITLPYNHKLPEFQTAFKLYDRKIAKIAKLIHTRTGGTCIDIGANVGDTALSIRATVKMPLLCIEGDSDYFSYLVKNTRNQDSITLVKCFVGKESEQVKGNHVKVNGTGKIVKDASGSREVAVSSLSDIVSRQKINPPDISLLKIDTDGFDFDILLGSKTFISANKPSIFFEYEMNSSASHGKSLELIDFLSRAGYKFIVYDNYGNFLSMIDTGFVQRFTDLNAYIKSCAVNGGGIYYADVFATADATILDLLYSEECSVY